MQLHTTFHYPPTPPVEGGDASADKLQVIADTALAVADSAAMHEAKAANSQGLNASSQPQQFHSLPTPPTPELTVATLQQQQQMQNGDLQPVPANSSQSCQQTANAPAYGAEPSKQQQLYQWQAAGSNFCVMGHPQFATPAPAAAAFPTRRPPPLYYQATEKTSVASAVAAAAQSSGPLRSPMSEFVVMKECIDGEL